MTMIRRFLTTLSLAGALGASAAHAAGYDATADFQTLSNPGGVWSYGYSHADGAGYSMTLFDLAGTSVWSMSNYGSLGTPAAFMNLGPTANGVATGQFGLHPGPAPNGDLAILRFTAPATGSYAITGQFFAGDSGSMQGLIILGDDAAHPLQSFANTTDASFFAPLTVTLASGAHIDFAVGNNGNFLFGSTPLSVQIEAAPVPEAGTALLMLSGLTLVACLGGRRRIR